jgi:hypothetical protein
VLGFVEVIFGYQILGIVASRKQKVGGIQNGLGHDF